MGRRIMTVDELYSFCLKNNFLNFDSKEFGKELVVEMPANFEKLNDDTDKMTEGLTPFVSRAFHDHINLNKSEIKEQDFKDNLPSSNLRPILANIKKDVDENGKEFTVEKTVYDEQPIGVIDGSKTSIEYDEEAKVNRAVLHGYLYNEYCQDAIDILNRRGTVDCSVELVIRQMSMDGKTKSLVLNDFYVAGLTLLSAKTKPGMAGSNFKIEDFSLENETQSFEKQLIEMQAKLNELEARFNINNTIRKEEEIEVEMNENFDEVTETEKVTETEETTEEEVTVTENESEETVDETSEDETVDEENSEETTDESDEETEDEESTVKEDNACGGGNSSTTKKKKKNNSIECSYEVDGETKKFAVSLQEKIYAIQDLVNATYAEADNTYYGVSVYEDYVVMCDYWSGRYYKQSYTSENDNYSLTGDRVEVYAEFVTSDEQKELDAMRSNYASLKEFKENAEKNELHAKREEILNNEKFASISDSDAFKELVKNMDNYSLDELEKEAKIIFADNISIETFAQNTDNKNTIKVFANVTKSKKDSRYGNLFSK